MEAIFFGGGGGGVIKKNRKCFIMQDWLPIVPFLQVEITISTLWYSLRWTLNNRATSVMSNRYLFLHKVHPRSVNMDMLSANLFTSRNSNTP